MTFPAAGTRHRAHGLVRPERGGWLRRRVQKSLERLSNGWLTIDENGTRTRFGNAHADLHATITVLDPRLYSRLASGGALGAAESYLDGDWRADDLVAALRIFARNIAVADQLDNGLARIAAAGARAVHLLRRNTRAGSRRNIRAHYDLGNEFFRIFLDDTLTYSCGIFERPDSTMAEASTAKIDRICRKLALGPGDHVLEIGTGWGSFALHAAGQYGCRVTTTTISPAQHDVAARRFRDAGLSDRITLLLQDYRDLTGQYDKLVSIEMIEAVGHQYMDGYFGACCRRLAPHGLMALQGIVMPDHRFAEYLRSTDFIQRHVFPGSALTSVSAMSASIARATDFRVTHLEDITPHYATTLRTWRDRFMARLPEVRALGYDDRFIRLWEYYMAYCEAGFAERYIGTVQVVLARPANRNAPILPPLDAPERAQVQS